MNIIIFIIIYWLVVYNTIFVCKKIFFYFFLSGLRIKPDIFYPDNYPDKNRVIRIYPVGSVYGSKHYPATRQVSASILSSVPQLMKFAVMIIIFYYLILSALSYKLYIDKKWSLSKLSYYRYTVILWADNILVWRTEIY